MLARVVGEGRYEIDDGLMERLNALDRQAVEALGRKEEGDLDRCLDEMGQLVRKDGRRIGDEELVASDIVIPPSDLTLEGDAQAGLGGRLHSGSTGGGRASLEGKRLGARGIRPASPPLSYDRPVTERALSLTEWAALGVLCEGRAHGWAVSAALLPEGEIGRVWSSSRPLTYRAISVLREQGHAVAVGSEASRGGPNRRLLQLTPKGRRAFRSWRSRPVGHVRELRSELMLKLLFHNRVGADSTALLERQRELLVTQERALGLRLHALEGFDRVLHLWRLSNIRAAVRFVQDLGGLEAHGAALYRPIGHVRSAWTTLAGMPLQPGADESGTAELHVNDGYTEALDDLDGFSHVWVLSHLHRVGGWEPHVLPFLDTRSRGTLATRSPRHPNPIGLSLTRIVSIAAPIVRVAGIDLLDGTPILDLKPYVPLFDAVPDASPGWFAGRAELIDTIRSDDRFGRGGGLESQAQ